MDQQAFFPGELSVLFLFLLKLSYFKKVNKTLRGKVAVGGKRITEEFVCIYAQPMAIGLGGGGAVYKGSMGDKRGHM